MSTKPPIENCAICHKWLSWNTPADFIRGRGLVCLACAKAHWREQGDKARAEMIEKCVDDAWEKNR